MDNPTLAIIASANASVTDTTPGLQLADGTILLAIIALILAATLPVIIIEKWEKHKANR